MAYTFLDNSLNTIGVLTNKGGQTNDYWGDSITHEIATSQDVLTSVSLSVDKPSVNIDTSGNQKTWNHVIQGLSFNIDGIGRKVNENDYLIYQEGTNGKYYLMAITQVDESAVQSGFHYKTVQGLNAAAYDLSRKTLRAKSFAQIPDNTQEKGTAQNILKYIFEDINWDVRTIGSFGAVDYDIAEGTTAQAVLLDIIGMFEAEVDAYVQLNNWGKGANVFNKNGSIKRIFDFSTSLGKYRGETIRYDKNMVSITKTGARDSMYTKLYVNGNNITIADANKGADFIVDDVANRKYNKLGAVSTPVTYLEGIISNSAIESPTALLAWGKKQLKILNHPRYNYQISATNDDKVQLGDTVIIQDTHASDPIYLKSKVISKSVSLAYPVNNSFIVGEFSPIVIGADNGLEDSYQIMQLVNQANQTAMNAQKKADANEKKIEDTRTDLEKTIDQKLQEGKDYSDSLDQKQKEAYDKFEAEINKGLEDAQKERDEISKKADDMLTTANSHADDMYNNAVAVAKDEASKALSDANTALYEAKTDLTDGLNKEIADRNKAVSAVNSQAQTYANQAKSDAIEAAKTADGQVRKDFKVTTDALSSTISQNKQDSDGKISTAQSTATQALNGLKTKVSQSDYDKKTGDLSTKVNTATQTATETKNELANVSKTVDSQSTKINTISNTVDGTTQTISDIKTEQGKQSGSIATLQSRADGFDATVTKVNNLSVGGRNYILNSSGINATAASRPSMQANGAGTYAYAAAVTYNSDSITLTYNGSNSVEWYYAIAEAYQSYASGNLDKTKQYTISVDVKGTVPAAVFRINNVFDKPVSINSSTWTKITHTFKFPALTGDTADKYYIRLNASGGTFKKGQTLSFRNFKLEDGNTPTAWTPAPEDLSGATAKAQLTADKANLDLSKYKTDADGRISKAQSDITATANEVKTKVSQSDYNTTTGDLTKKYGQVKATADAVTTDVAKYKKSNDGKVSANSASIETLNNQITSKVSQSDFDKKTGELSGNYTETKQTVAKISNTVTELQAKANAQGQVNQLVNTEFTPDLEGWDVYGNISGDNLPNGWVLDKTTSYKGSNVISTNTVGTGIGNQFRHIDSVPIPVQQGQKITLSYAINVLHADPDANVAGYWKQYFQFLDENKNKVSQTAGKGANNTPTNGWIEQTSTTVTVPDNARYVVVDMYTRFEASAMLSKPMLVFDDHVGDYVQGNYNNNSRVTALELDVNGIHGTVNDPKKGLSATWDLANQGQTLAVKAQKDAKTADGKAVAAQKDATTAVTTAKGTQTTVTSVQKDVKDVQSKQTQTANQLTTEIKDRKNGDTNTLTQAKNFTSSSITKSETGLRTEIQQSADGVVAQVQYVNRLFNTQFTPDLVGWNVANNGAGGFNNNFYRSYLRNGETVVGVDTTNVTTKYYAYFEQDVALPGNNGGTVVSLTWDAKTNTMNNYANLWINFRKADGTDIDKVHKRWDTPVGKGWQTQKWENISVPKDADHIHVSFQTREGTNAYLSRPMLTFTPKAQTYMPGGYHSTSTVLELFDGRFALGIKNNTGKIISGINGDSSGLSIVGKKITISGDTTFLGKNFMDGALIKNASIDGAKIKNLEVDKLTGNTTNFVKSSWDNAYGDKLFINSYNIVFFTNSMRSATTISEGRIHMAKYNDYTKITESVGGIKHSLYPRTQNQDYLNIYLDGWGTQGGHGSGAADHGGDGILFSVSDGAVQKDGPGTRLLEWDNELLASTQGIKKGWHFWDFTEVKGEDFMVTPKGAYQGLRIGSYNYNGTTYPTIMGDQMKGNGPGILMGSTEMYFMYKKKVYKLSDILKGKTWKV